MATNQVQVIDPDEDDEDERLLRESGLSDKPAQQQMMMPIVDGLPASVIENAYKATTEVLVRVYSARANKRDTEAWANAVYEMCDKPEFSERALYNVSVGKDKKTKKETFAEGPSVHLARTMAAMYPNFEWDIVEHGITTLPDGTKQAQFEVWAWDYETNSRARQLASVNLPRWAYSDVQIRRAQMSAQAFVVRNIIFAKLPQDVVANAFEKARERQNVVNAELEKDKKKFLVELATAMRVTPEQLLEVVNVDSVEKLKASDIRVLKSFKNSIAAGEINPADIWEGAFNKRTNKDKAAAQGDDSKPPEEAPKQKTPAATNASAGGSGKASTPAPAAAPPQKADKPPKSSAAPAPNAEPPITKTGPDTSTDQSNDSQSDDEEPDEDEVMSRHPEDDAAPPDDDQEPEYDDEAPPDEPPPVQEVKKPNKTKGFK